MTNDISHHQKHTVQSFTSLKMHEHVTNGLCMVSCSLLLQNFCVCTLNIKMSHISDCPLHICTLVTLCCLFDHKIKTRQLLRLEGLAVSQSV